MAENNARLDYRVPLGLMIGRNRSTERLYRLEEKRDAAIMAAVKELQNVLQLKDFWREALPEALLSILEHFDETAAELAALAYLAKRGTR